VEIKAINTKIRFYKFLITEEDFCKYFNENFEYQDSKRLNNKLIFF
jgi:hypothetical protein